MVQRLTERFAPGSVVQIQLGENRWVMGVVGPHQPPGIWVFTRDGQRWFVTNTRRIRPYPDVESDDTRND